MTAAYSLADFGHLTSPKQLISNTILEGDIPSVQDVMTDAKWDGIQKKVFLRDPEDFEGGQHDRSRSMANLAHHGAELGWSDVQIYAVLDDADKRWGKYTERHNREAILLDLINIARQKHGYNPAVEFDIDKILSSNLVVRGDDEDEAAGDTQHGDDLGVMSIDEINAIESTQDWLLDGLIHSQGLGLLTGRQGTGKTQIALQLAACLATGQERFIHWDIKSNGAKKVLFLSLEMGMHTLKTFTTPLRTNYPEPDLAKNLPVLPIGDALPLDTDSGQAYFERLLERHKPDLVIIDSLETIASTELTDETSVKKLMNFLVGAKTRHSTAILVIHHHRKRSNDFASQKRPNTIYDVYGSNYITSKIDFDLDVDNWRDSKGEQPDKNRLTLVDLKNRLGPMMDRPIEVKRDHTLHFTMYDEDAVNRIAGDLIDDFDTDISF